MAIMNNKGFGVNGVQHIGRPVSDTGIIISISQQNCFACAFNIGQAPRRKYISITIIMRAEEIAIVTIINVRISLGIVREIVEPCRMIKMTGIRAEHYPIICYVFGLP